MSLQFLKLLACFLLLWSHCVESICLTASTGNTRAYDRIFDEELGLTKSVTFTVRAAHDAHIGFFTKSKSTEEVYEIVIGGWGNSRSAIRRKNQGANKKELYRHGIVSSSEARAFWASADNGLIQLGHGIVVGQQVIFSWQDPIPLETKYVGIMTGWGSTGEWNVCIGDYAIEPVVFDDVDVQGDDNLIFIGDFPQLKLCEGSSNEGEGAVACCIVIGPTALVNGNCARHLGTNNNYVGTGRRQLTQCPAGSWNLANACDEFQEFCHNQDAVNGCTSCAHCTQSKLCPECYVSQLSDLGTRRLLDVSSHSHLMANAQTPPHTLVDLSYTVPVGCGGTAPGAIPCRKKLKVNGTRNLIFVGHFPQLKMCEGSGNKNSGQASCCVAFGENAQTQVQNCKATRRALKDFNEDCPSGTFNIRNSCEEMGEWCHDEDGPINGCMDCRACMDPTTCPTCTADRRKY